MSVAAARRSFRPITSSGVWLVRLLVVLLAYLLPTFGAPAESVTQLQLKELLTPEGRLVIRPGKKGADCFDCVAAYLNGRQILTDQYVFIDSVFPSLKNPQLVSISTSSGGNCCPPTKYVLDFTVKPHLTVKGFGFGTDIADSENGVVFTDDAEDNEVSDHMLGVYEYRWGSGKAVLKKKTPVYSTSPLSRKQYPSDVLDDPTLRTPLIELMGAKGFAQFRLSTTVAGQDQLKVLNNGIVIGSGCFPHACPDDFGLFIIDTKRKLAWAAEGQENNGAMNAKIWGKITPLDILEKTEIGRWLDENKIPRNAVSLVPLPTALAQRYGTTASNNTLEPQDTSGRIKLAVETNDERHDALSPIQLFKTLAPDIYIVNAKRSNGDEFQGSAVAVSSTDLLTNCHVVADSASITLEQKDSVTKASLISTNVDADRCVLRSERPLAAFAPIRPFDSLQVGEKVYSIGAPAGLELTISDGLLSGKRATSDRRLVQTTAPISPGSSGGGLFDEAGNLIGITTFRLKDAENLNFAISAEDYLLQ
jgi:hypothetical protein